MSPKKNSYFIWVSDCYSNTGEGKLAINFIKKLSHLKKHNIIIKTPNLQFTSYNHFKKKINLNNFYKSNFSFFFRYTVFLLGIFYLWVNYLSGKKVVYINYLPLWNFFIFFLSPPGTIFGPITGSLYKRNNKNEPYSFIRKYIFPFFFKISVFLLRLRNLKYFFSTSQLESVIKNKNLKYLSNIQLLFFKNKKKNKNKYYDLLIYNRKHENKFSLNFETIFSNKLFYNKKILVLGEKINLPNIKNLGFLPHNKVQNYLDKTKFTIISAENIYSFFFFDSIRSSVITLFSNKIKYNKKIIKIKKNNFISLDDTKKFLNLIIPILNKKIRTGVPKINTSYLYDLSKNFNTFKKELF